MMKNISDFPFLYEFQRQGVQELLNGKQLLADGTGMGKSVEILSYCECMPYTKILLIVPNPLKINWLNELEKFFGIKGIVLEGKLEERKQIFDDFIKSDNKYLISNYEQLNPRNAFLQTFFWHCLIFDEAHRVKNYRTKTYRFGKKIQASHRIGLTATPLTNHALEIFSIVNFLKPNFFNWYTFRTTYGVFGQVFKGPKLGYQTDIVDWKNLDDLNKILNTLMIKREKKDVLPQLPSKIYKTYYVELSDEEQRIHDHYFQLMKDAFDKKDDQMFSYLSLMQQISGGTRLLSLTDSENKIESKEDENSKLDVLKDILNSIGFE